MLYVVIVSVTGIVALTAAVVALIGGSTAALTILIASMIALWAMATGRHLMMNRTHDLTAVH